MEEEDSPMTRHERLLGSVVRAQKLAKRGRFTRTGKEAADAKRRQREWLDPSLTQRILDDYLNSEGRVYVNTHVYFYFRVFVHCGMVVIYPP